jgi:hypothetical protein
MLHSAAGLTYPVQAFGYVLARLALVYRTYTWL